MGLQKRGNADAPPGESGRQILTLNPLNGIVVGVCQTEKPLLSSDLIHSCRYRLRTRSSNSKVHAHRGAFGVSPVEHVQESLTVKVIELIS